MVYAIHISIQKKESIAIIPFEPRCLAAGYGWIAVGGPNGECAYLRLNERGLQVRDDSSPLNPSDVDSALPLDLDLPSRFSSPTSGADGATSSRHSPRRRLAEFVVHRFGGNIVNSVTIHRFPAKEEHGLGEDVIIIRYDSLYLNLSSLMLSY